MTRRRRNAWSDQRIEEIIGDLLRAGVIIGAFTALLGGIIYLARHGAEAPSYRMFVGEQADLRGVSGIIADARAFSGRGIIQLGLLLLLATPIARVIISVVAFAFQHDWVYVVITAIVLATLGYSFFWGLRNRRRERGKVDRANAAGLLYA